MNIKNNQDITSKLLHRSSIDRLVFQNPSIRRIIEDASLIVIFCISIIFMSLPFTLNTINSLGIFSHSKLSCNRDKGEVICSLTGQNFYGNVEQVFSPKHEKLILSTNEIYSYNENPDESIKYDLLVLVTERKKILLLTQRSISQFQSNQINHFLQESAQRELKIQTNSYFYINSSHVFSLIFTFVIPISCLLYFIRDIVTTEIFSLDRENNSLRIRKIFRRKFSFEIPFQSIKQVVLTKNNGNHITNKISLIGDNDSILLSINLDSKYASEIANSLCIFLQFDKAQVANRDDFL